MRCIPRKISSIWNGSQAISAPPPPPFFFELWKWEIQVRRRESNGLKMDHDLLGFYLEAHFLGEGIPALDETEQRTVDVCL